MKVVVCMPDNSVKEEQVNFGAIKRIPLEEGKKAEVEIFPFRRGDVGRGPGKRSKVVVEGGVSLE